MTPATSPDATAARAQAGDPAALHELFDWFVGRALRILREEASLGRLRSDDVRDVAGDASRRLLRRLDTWDPARGPFRTFANVVIRTELAEHRRQLARRPRISPPPVDEDGVTRDPEIPDDNGTDPVTRDLAARALSALRSHCDSLDPASAQVIWAVMVQEWSQAEAARHWGRSPDAVYRLVARTRDHLRTTLARELSEPGPDDEPADPHPTVPEVST